jgi:hypothetical protein
MTPTDDHTAPAAPQHQYKDAPESDPLAKQWGERIASARKHWEWYHELVKHNRKVVAGFDKKKKPGEKGFRMHRANLIHGTITAILPNIYARNPEMSVTGNHQARDLKLLCKTIEKVTNRQLNDAKLKKRGKASVRAALTASLGVVKVMYQRDMQTDPFIKARIQDTQDNIAHIEGLLLQINDPQARAEQEAAKAELKQTLDALQEKVEIVAGEGLVIDRILSDHLLMDTAIAEFEDYPDSDWLVQLIPMKKSTAEGIYGYRLDKAKTFKGAGSIDSPDSNKIFSGKSTAGADDAQICICEIWDKTTQRVYTLAEGCDWFLKEPFSPARVGERWYPFFLLPFQLVDGEVIGPSLVDLTEELQTEHNSTRDKENAHRDLIKPGYVASSEVNEKTIKRFQDSLLGEITIVDTEGKPLAQVIAPKQYPPMDPAAYDTSKVRYDWEQVSGMQDAARSTVVQPKTATEASIMQQSLSGRVSEFRDQVEDFLQEIAQYAAQILLQELTPQQVERIMGPHKMGPIPGPNGQPMLDQMGQPVIGVIEPSYDWPQLSREEVFDLVQLQIRAGTTGEPDKIEQQEVWLKLMPAIQPLITQIMQIQQMGGDAAPLIALLKETVARFDEKLDVDQFIPKKPVMPAMPPAMPGAPQGMPAGAPPQLQAVA